MIERIYSGIAERLSDSCCGEKIGFYHRAYGAGYDFCRFYSADSGIFLIYNSSLTADCVLDEEVRGFIGAVCPDSVETMRCEENIRGYRRIPFWVMKKTAPGDVSHHIPDKDIIRDRGYENIFGIMQKCFGIDDLGLWYTHASHCVRHGLGGTFLIEDTAAARTEYYPHYAYLSGIAVVPSRRGEGFCRRIAAEAEYAAFAEYREVRLCCFSEMTALYGHLGYSLAEKGYYHIKEQR